MTRLKAVTCSRCDNAVCARGLCRSHYDAASVAGFWTLTPPDIIDRPEPGWYEKAACRDTDRPDDWFIEGDVGRSMTIPDHVLETCGGCEVRSSCLAAAWDLPECQSRYGVWAGLTPSARLRMRRRVAS